MGATLFEIIRGESWLFLFVGQFFASVIWVAMPWLVGRTATAGQAAAVSPSAHGDDPPDRPV